MASAADVTFKEVVREACLSRDHFMAWTDGAGSAAAAAAPSVGRARRRSDDGIEDVEREIVDGPTAAIAWQRIAAILGVSSKSDQDQARRLREALASPAPPRSTGISACSSPEGKRPQIGGDKKIL